MWVYLSLLCLPLLWAAARASHPHGDKLARIAIVLILAVLIGLRREVGGDWDFYLLIFRRAQAYPLVDAAALIDPGYMMLARLVAALGLGAGVLNLVVAALFAAGLVLFCARQPSPPVALFVAIPVLVVIGAMGFTRQAAAASLVMMALALWRPGRRLLPAILFILAPLFHWSALIFLPLLLALFTRQPRSPWPPLLLGLALGVLGLVTIMANEVMAEHVAVVETSAGASLRMAPSLAALLLYLLFHERLHLSPEQEAQAGFWCGLVAFLVPLLLAFPTIADRFNLYAVLFQMTVASHAVRLPHDARARSIAATLIAIPYILLYTVWLNFSAYRVCWLPYRTYLGSPGDLLSSSVPERPRLSAACADVQQQFIAVRRAPGSGRSPVQPAASSHAENRAAPR